MTTPIDQVSYEPELSMFTITCKNSKQAANDLMDLLDDNSKSIFIGDKSGGISYVLSGEVARQLVFKFEEVE